MKVKLTDLHAKVKAGLIKRCYEALRLKEALEDPYAWLEYEVVNT